jgi:hypothetical protein
MLLALLSYPAALAEEPAAPPPAETQGAAPATEAAPAAPERGGTVSVGKVKVKGGLGIDQVLPIVQSDLGQIRYCYERSRLAQPSLGGTFVVEFTIGSDGLVATPAVRLSTLDDAGVESCVASRVQTLSFPTPSGGRTAKVSVPLVFVAP